MGYGLYLYGIFPAPGPKELHLKGLDAQPVHTQLIDQFAFLYSEAQQERYLASRRNLLGHERVLEEAMKAGYSTLLPLQFGLIVQNWENVIHQLIYPYHAGLKQLFKKLENRREVGIKVFWEPEEELQQLMAEHQDLQEKKASLEGKPLSMDQVISIGQEIEQAINSRQQEIVEKFQEILNPLALEVVENELLTDKMIYNAAYLIPWDAEPSFSETVEALDHLFDSRLKIRYNNFTAPYNFAQLNQL
jgi:hypothetical protein